MLRSKCWLAAGVVAVVALAMAACDHSTVYDHFEHAPLGGWEKNDTLSFRVSLQAPGSYTEELGLRIDGLFPFMSLALVIDQTVMPSGRTMSDTLVCSLISSDGISKGAGVSYYQYRFPIGTLSVGEGDSLLHVIVRHNMKREILPGVADVGIRIATK